jgi:hypothetical protein
VTATFDEKAGCGFHAVLSIGELFLLLDRVDGRYEAPASAAVTFSR